ncbi:MAG: pyridoxal phosphate-dependent aminotransferase [Gammaproteobacteria bacterium]|nr:pyridoxal phosphate-dependent aminotransferase [Gammaproteobacteria bacterium]
MAFLSKNMARIPASQTMVVSNLARELAAAGQDIISMSTGEPDFDTVPVAASAGIEAIRTGQTRYTAGDGTPELKQAVQAKFKRDNGLFYELRQISVANGGKQVIYNAMAATLDAGDEVIIPAPYWVSYPAMVAMCGGTPRYVRCHASNGFALNPVDLEAAITAKTKWVLLNFPNNPSGSVMSAKHLLAIAQVLRRHPHVHILTDDMYEYLQYTEEPFVTLAQVAPDLYDRILTVSGMSKGYAMTGWRIGFAGGRADLIAAMAVVQSQITANPCSIAQAAATEALLSAPDHISAWHQVFIERRDIVVSALRGIDGIQVHVPQGAFYAFPNVEGLYGRQDPDGIMLNTAADVATYWLKSAGVAVVPGEAFGYPGHVRLSYSIATDRIRQALERLSQACAALL